MYRIIIGKVAQKENVIDPALLLSVKHGIWSHLVKWIFFQFRKHSLSQIKLLNRVCISASASYQYNQYKEAKTRKLWSKSRCWEAWRRRWWSVSARRWVIGDKISVWPDFGQAGATLPARSEELSLPIVRRESGTEGADSRLLVLPYSHRPQGAQKAALLQDHLNLVVLPFVVKKNNLESERRHSSVLGSNRLILS